LRRLTLLIPALNEENAISETVNSLYSVAKEVLDDVEIIIVNDGSTDNTGEIINQLAAENSAILTIHHNQPQGLGYIFREGIAKAKFEFLSFIPGDNAYNASSLKPFFEAVSSTDMVLGYRINQSQTRQLYRVFISLAYSFVMRLLFAPAVRDFHAIQVFPVQRVRALRLTSTVSQVEFIVKLLRSGVTYTQIPVELNSDKSGKSRSLRWKTFVSVFKMVIHLLLPRHTSSEK
jgi:dolichol-phosphate mannosyltransferase